MVAISSYRIYLISVKMVSQNSMITTVLLRRKECICVAPQFVMTVTYSVLSSNNYSDLELSQDLLQSHWVFLLKTSYPSIVLGGCFWMTFHAVARSVWLVNATGINIHNANRRIDGKPKWSAQKNYTSWLARTNNSKFVLDNQCVRIRKRYQSLGNWWLVAVSCSIVLVYRQCCKFVYFGIISARAGINVVLLE